MQSLRYASVRYVVTDTLSLTRGEASASSDRRSATDPAPSDEALEPLFRSDLAETYRARWTSIQSGFVDDPRHAVRSGDELVAQIMTDLASTFA